MMTEHEGAAASKVALAAKNLTTAQRRHLAQLVTQINHAQVALDAATRAMEVAQNNADAFILYCAEENAITLGTDGWKWSTDELRFVQLPALSAPATNGNGA